MSRAVVRGGRKKSKAKGTILLRAPRPRHGQLVYREAMV
jgi:hypothetical protein